MAWYQKFLSFFSSSNKDSFIQKIERLIGFQIKNVALYRLAFQHKSKNKENNERLEFLGDSILDSVISDLIYKHFPNKDEGALSKLRSKTVSRTMLNKLANNLGLLELLSYRETHTAQGLRNSEGNTMEALIGAIYLDQGYEKAKFFITTKLVTPFIDWQKLEKQVVDHKSLLYAHAQKSGKTLNFALLNDDLKNLESRFLMAVLLDGVELSKAHGKSKKVAEQKASKIALQKIQDNLV